jgi:hypothetical protein
MNDYARFHAEGRRLALLRCLVRLGGDMNETALLRVMRALEGYGDCSHDDLRADLDHLVRAGATRDRWVGPMRIPSLTERGEDAAWGRVAIEGVPHERWRDGPEG